MTFHRGPMSPLSQRADRQTRQNTPRYTALRVPEHRVCHESFLLVYRNRGCLPEVKQTIIDMSLNASGIRDTARVLRISTDTVLSELKKKEAALAVSEHRCYCAPSTQTILPWTLSKLGKRRWMKCGVLSARKGTSAGCGMPLITTRVPSWPMSLGVARMRSFCSSKRCWSPLVSRAFIPTIGGRTPGIWTADVHSPGKRNTQKIERKHLTLRTRIKRLVRKTICFSKTTQMHDIVIGLFVNRYAFGLLV